MDRVKLGVIGLGMASAPHVAAIRDLQDAVAFVAGYSPTEKRRAAFADRFGLPIMDDLDALIQASDALLVLAPPNAHHDLVAKIALSGRPILLEKPLEITLARSIELVEIAERHSAPLGIVLQHRFRRTVKELSDAVASGRLGQVVSASASLSNWRPQGYYDEPGRGTLARDGGGVLLTQGIHTLDALIAIAGAPHEATALAVTSAVHRMETEDLSHGLLRYANGAIGAVSATTAAYPGYPDRIEIIGTKGTARIEGTKLTIHHVGGAVGTLDDETGGGVGADPMAFPHANHRECLADFVDAVMTGRPPRVTGREALKVHRLIDAILRSSVSGKAEAC